MIDSESSVLYARVASFQYLEWLFDDNLETRKIMKNGEKLVI